MTITINSAQTAFEREKDNPMVQAILKQLGKLREHVINWECSTKEPYIYKAVLSDGREVHGEVLYVWQNKEWIASGTLVPSRNNTLKILSWIQRTHEEAANDKQLGTEHQLCRWQVLANDIEELLRGQ